MENCENNGSDNSCKSYVQRKLATQEYLDVNNLLNKKGELLSKYRNVSPQTNFINIKCNVRNLRVL